MGRLALGTRDHGGLSLSEVKYYSIVPLGKSEPVAVFRYFEDKGKSPQYFNQKGEGWIDDPTLWAQLASGEMDNDDLIPEEEAERLVKQWGGSL